MITIVKLTNSDDLLDKIVGKVSNQQILDPTRLLRKEVLINTVANKKVETSLTAVSLSGR